MTPLAPILVTGKRARRAIAIVAFASIALQTGCSSIRSIDDASPAEAASEISSVETPIVTETTAPLTVPTLQELLAQDRFVPLKVALERSGLDIVIAGLDDFVLLAPTGTAFASTGADIGIEYPTLMNNPRLLEAIMRYHIVANPATNPTWRTLNGSALDIDGSAADAVELVDGVEVLDRIVVRNGIVLLLPRLLVPASDRLVISTEPQQD